MNPTELAIEQVLCNLADNNQEFAVIFQKEKKTIKECCQYIASEVKKMKRGFINEVELIGLAKEYYSNDKLEFTKVNFTTSVASNDPKFVEKMKEREEKKENNPIISKDKKKIPLQMTIFDVLEQ